MAFMGITSAFLDKNFKPYDIILGFKHIPGDHSGANIANNFYDVIQFYYLQEKASSFYINIFF